LLISFYQHQDRLPFFPERKLSRGLGQGMGRSLCISDEAKSTPKKVDNNKQAHKNAQSLKISNHLFIKNG